MKPVNQATIDTRRGPEQARNRHLPSQTNQKTTFLGIYLPAAALGCGNRFYAGRGPAWTDEYAPGFLVSAQYFDHPFEG